MNDAADATRGRVVLVLGATSGMGLATALRFAAGECKLVLVARSADSLAVAAQRCRAAGAGQVDVCAADVTDPRGVQSAVGRAVDEHGHLDVVVLTAAVMAYGSVEDVPPEVFARVVDTAVTGTANTARAVLPVFRRQGSGTLIVVNSLLGSVTVPRMGAYATAKWGQRALVRTLQQELRSERGIHVCLVSPGSVNTPIYYQAANYLGRSLRPPWPVRSPEHAADVIAGLADRPRSHVSVPVGATNPVIISGFRLLPFVYDRVVRVAFRLASVTGGEVRPTTGNVEAPQPANERVHGHWPEPSDDGDRGPSRSGTARAGLAERGPALLRQGYPYLSRLRGGRPATVIRLLGRRTTVVSGRAGAQLFYDQSLMQRAGAVPRPLRRTLFGDGAVHGLDDAPHEHRKAMFTGLLTPDVARSVAERAGEQWRRRDLAGLDLATLFDAAVQAHCAAICDWAGVPADAGEGSLAHDLIAMVDGFGSVGMRHVHARAARHRADRWAAELVAKARTGRIDAPAASAVAVVARHRNEDGAVLSARVAGVELLNILRPTVAVSYFVAFSAHALAADPALREWLASGDDARFEAFAHEVRRYYPFVPMLAARVRRRTSFAGRRLPRGRRVLLDVYGMLHDPTLWPEPARFDPARFLDREPDAFEFVAQGGGDVHAGHRCPGERLAIELIKTAARLLVAQLPTGSGDWVIPLNRFPTRPFALR